MVKSFTPVTFSVRWHKRRMITTNAIYVALAMIYSLDAHSPDYVMVPANLAPMRSIPSDSAQIIKYASPTLQLKVLNVSADSLWYMVKIGESKGYQLAHSERYWIKRSDIVEPDSLLSTLIVDVSVYEKPEGYFGRRVTEKEFLSSKGQIQPPFYVSPVVSVRSFQPGCSTQLSKCGRVVLPDDYELVTLDRPDTQPLFDRLYGDGELKIRYDLTTIKTIRSIRERLILGKVLVNNAGCYPDEYRGTEVTILLDTVRSIIRTQISSSSSLQVMDLIASTAVGEVQYFNLMYLLDIIYTNGIVKTVVRRIQLSWPHCL